METQLVKIIPDDVGWLEWGWGAIRANPGKTVAGGIVALSLLPFELPVAATGLVVAGISGLTVGGVSSLFQSSEIIEEVELRNARDLVDLHGKPIKQPAVYARHPNVMRNGVVIPAGSFHSIIIAEQIADLAAFIRSKVRAESIDIAVFAENGAAVSVDAALPSDKFAIRAHAGSARHHSLELRYGDPEIVQISRKLFWMQAFPEIQIAFEGARNGKVARSVSVDTTFGLSASLAKSAGIDANWLGRQRFEVSATFT